MDSRKDIRVADKLLVVDGDDERKVERGEGGRGVWCSFIYGLAGGLKDGQSDTLMSLHVSQRLEVLMWIPIGFFQNRTLGYHIRTA